MFDSISEKLDSIFKKLKGKGLIKEEDIDLALKEVRIALLEADVNLKVVKDFIQNVKAKALGKEDSTRSPCDRACCATFHMLMRRRISSA